MNSNTNFSTIVSGPSGFTNQTNSNMHVNTQEPEPIDQDLQASPTMNAATTETPEDNWYYLCPNSVRDADDMHYEIHPINGQRIKCYSAQVAINWAEAEEVMKSYNNFFDFSQKEMMPRASIYTGPKAVTVTAEQRERKKQTEKNIYLLEKIADEAKELLKIQEFLAKKN